jgi:hypothetical protein
MVLPSCFSSQTKYRILVSVVDYYYLRLVMRIVIREVHLAVFSSLVAWSLYLLSLLVFSALPQRLWFYLPPPCAVGRDGRLPSPMSASPLPSYDFGQPPRPRRPTFAAMGVLCCEIGLTSMDGIDFLTFPSSTLIKSICACASLKLQLFFRFDC